MTVETKLVWTLRDNVSATAKKLNNNLDAVGVRAKGATGILGKLNTATGGLVTPTSLAAAGALAFVGVMADATRKAIEEEANIRKLDAALKANVVGWNGNTTAIEQTISAREQLAFSDDDLRNSLAQIVAATHNVAEAEKVQATAMDLARLKGISLADASEALIRVEGGSYRILKSLGIVLKAGATQTEALAAVQKVAAGQAEAYAKTTEAKVLVAQIKLDDAMENLGLVTMPLVAAGAQDIADGLDIMTTAAEGAGRAAKQLGIDLSPLIMSLPKVIATLWDEAWRHMHKAFGDGATGVTAEMTDMERAVGVSTGRMATAAESDSRRTVVAWRGMTDAMVTDTQTAINDAFDPTIQKYEQVALNSEVTAARVAVATGKVTAAEKLALAEAQKAAAEHLLLMAQSGNTTSKTFSDGLAELERNAKASTGATKKRLDEIIAKIKELQRLGKQGVTITFKLNKDGSFGTGKNKILGDGGHLNAGEPAIVGDKGPEWFVPDKAGTVIPNGGGSPMSSGSSGGGSTIVHTTINLDGKVLARVVDEHLFSSFQRAAPTAGRV